jgi:allantoate deiminase/N-carbamoyl-L-amino-acid hydrolase
MMNARRDALVAASWFIASVPSEVKKRGEEHAVATVGAIRAEPGSVNVIPGRCVFSLEIRDRSLDVMGRLYEVFENMLREMDIAFGTRHSISRVLLQTPTRMTGWVSDAVRSACELLECGHMTITSGAFHDSLVMSSAFPTGMIFIPSVGGVSHSPDEESRTGDVDMGCNVLLQTILRLDRLEGGDK